KQPKSKKARLSTKAETVNKDKIFCLVEDKENNNTTSWAVQTEEEIKNQEANDIDKRPRKEHQLNTQQTQVNTENHMNQENVTQGNNKEHASHMANDIDKKPGKEHQLNMQQTQVNTENHMNQENMTQGNNKEHASYITNIQLDKSVGQTNDKQDKTLPDPAQCYINILKLNGREGKQRQWSDLFSKLKGGNASFTNQTTRSKILSKNKNALIINIYNLYNISTNDIITTLSLKLSGDLVVAKSHSFRGKRISLELVFKSKKKVQKYAFEEISLFQQTFFGYIPASVEARQLLREAKLQKKELTAHKMPTSELEFSPDNPYTKKTLDTKEEDTSKSQNINKTNVALQSIEIVSPVKESDTPMPDALLTEPSLRHERPSVIDDKEQKTPFIVVSYRKPKNKNKERSTESDGNLLHPGQNQKALEYTHQGTPKPKAQH
ncbi:8419_t:CDS:2, partial [Dentiscutata erythropus]